MLSERYDKLKTKAISIRSQVEQSYNSAKDLKLQLNEKTKQLEDEKESLSLQGFAIDTLKEIMDKMSQEHIERVVALLTYALQTIFYDKEYSVEIVTSDKRNSKTAEFMLVEKNDTGVIRTGFTDSIGGGILAVVGLVLQVYYTNLLGMAPVLFLDEALSQVSVEYIPNLMQFIKELASQQELIMVLISHDDRIIPYADRTYRVDDGVVTEEK